MDIRNIPATTPISFETFKTITNSNGQFVTWTDIVVQGSSALPINDEILGSLVKGITEITGDNVVFNNTENKNVGYFNDDVSIHNNKITRDKWVMYLYQDYMLTLEITDLDRKSALEWASYVEENMNSQFIAKNDIQNALCVWETYLLALAIGNFRLIAGCDGDANFLPSGEMNYTPWKNLGFKLTDIFQKQRRTRTKFAKGYKKEQARFLTSQQLALRLLGGLTANSASTPAYEAIKNTAQPYQILTETYGSTMYLGQEFGMSEFTVGGNVQNKGQGTGNLTQPFFLENLHGLLYYIESIQVFGHGQLASDQARPYVDANGKMSRTKSVWSFIWRMQAAVLPIYARFNIAFINAIPKFPAWTDTNGVVHAAMDLSKADDYNTLCNTTFLKQPNLYSAFLDGASKITQPELNALWQKNTITWKA